MSEPAGAIGSLTLPKGGGALSGIGEKFAPDLHTGTGNFSVPIALPPGRNGFQPNLALNYSTGHGNGAFGQGWSLTVPGVSRLTAKGVPRYQDDTDVYVLSGVEDLVPIEGAWPGKVRYRPRTEGLFSRIERHLNPDPIINTDHWEVAGKDGLVSVYGTPGRRGADPAAIADPARRDHVFAWKLSETRDPFGNRIRYDYLPKDPAQSWDQAYLARIRYVDYVDPLGAEQFLVQVTFHYHDRPDPFSERRAGFDIRTVKRCVRIDVHVSHRANHVVRRYALEYLDQRVDVPNLASLLPMNGVSLLNRITVTGIAEDGTEESLPALEFGYTTFDPAGRSDLVTIAGTDLPSTSLADPSIELVDLTGNGMPDILQMNGDVRWWRNLGNGRFDMSRRMELAPSLHLADEGVMMLDADGDGRTDLVVANGVQAGYFPLSHDAQWERDSFVPHRRTPSFSLTDPEVRLIDLDGDGAPDVLRRHVALECWFNRGRDGWSELRPVALHQLSGFPDVSFSDTRVRTADMSGDQLQDIVLVDDGSVRYWPSLGHGVWGQPVEMRNGPRLPYGYDLRRMLIGDVDGDGLADLIYVENGFVTLWINRGGLAWTDPIEIRGTPSVTDMDSVRLADLIGSGVTGVLWSTDANLSGRAQLFFLDLTGGGKPYLLVSMDNHRGARTTVDYTSSATAFNVDARQPATRWKTTLPFPVPVVSRVIVTDAISGTQLATTYTYHHGHWDGGEREFRGFGRVEQRDTESSIVAGLPPELIGPPILTKTWFHLGPVGPAVGDWREVDLSNEYWSDDPVRFRQHPSIASLPMDNSIARRIKRDALRALRGSVLRTESYAEDSGPRAVRPYTVTESRHAVREIESPVPTNADRRRIFFPHLRVQRTTQWERGDDPMTSVVFTDGYDAFGQPTRQTTVVLPRRSQRRVSVNGILLDEPNILATHSRTRYVDAPGATSPYIADRVCETERFEPATLIPPLETDPADLREIVTDHVAAATAVHADFMADRNLRRNGHVRSYYDGPSFVGLSLGRIASHGSLTRTETLVFTDVELNGAYDSRRPAYLDGPMNSPVGGPMFTSAALGYRRVVAGGGLARYYCDSVRRESDVQAGAAQPRGLVVAVRDPLGHETRVTHDEYGLFPVRVNNAAGLITQAAYSYRTMQPERIVDVNGNAQVVEYSPLGLPARLFLEGRNGEGGTRSQPEARYVYDFAAFDASGDPVSVTTIKRVYHAKDGISNETIRTTDYSDGFGRQVQSRRQAEQVIFGDPVFGDGLLPAAHGDPAADRRAAAGSENASAAPNVVVSGWQRFDNKGRIIEKYEPCFDRGWNFDPLQLAPSGQAIRMRYDPRGQLIRTIKPDGTEQRVIFGVPRAFDTPDTYDPTPWECYAYDANDLGSATFDPATGASHAGGAPSAHHHTPVTTVFDARGRTRARIERDGSAPGSWLVTRRSYDARDNLLAITDPLGRVALQQSHDLLDRPLKMASVDGGIRTTVFDATGAPVEYRDSKGAISLRRYDVLNRLVEVWAQDHAAGAFTLREHLVYGDGGSATQPTAARDASRGLNQLGRPVVHDDEAGRTTYERYDSKGNSIERVRQVISDGALASGWTPDWSPLNAAASLDPTPYRTSNRYDALNRPVAITGPVGVNGTRVVVQPVFNSAGALAQVLLNGEMYVARLAYNARGQRTLLAYGNGTMTRYAYDSRTSRLQRLRTEQYQQPDRLTLVPTGTVHQDYAHAYDLVGNLTRIDERVRNCGVPGTVDVDRLVRHFSYDPFYRLTSATGRETDAAPAAPPWLETALNIDPTRTRAYTETYAYDRAGNMQSVQRSTVGTRTYSPQTSTNRLQSLMFGTTPASTFQYTYDGNGNMTAENTSRRYQWDHADRLIGFEEGPAGSTPTVRARYLYGADGRRVKKWVRKGAAVNDESTTYIEGLFEHHRWQDGGPKQNNRVHVMDGENRIALVRIGDRHSADGGELVQYHLGDHLGSCAVIVGGANAQASTLLSREEHTPFGETSFGSFARKRYRFNGKERDEESRLCYYGTRYYAPHLMKWISVDPVLFQSGRERPPTRPLLNGYSFSHNRPLILRDPDGNEPKKFAAYLVPDVRGPGTTDAALSQASEVAKSFRARGYEVIDFKDMDGLVARLNGHLGPDDTMAELHIWTHGTPGEAMLPSREARPVTTGERLFQDKNTLRQLEARLGVEADQLQSRATKDTKIQFHGCDIGNSEELMNAVGLLLAVPGAKVTAPTVYTKWQRVGDEMTESLMASKTKAVPVDSPKGKALMKTIQVTKPAAAPGRGDDPAKKRPADAPDDSRFGPREDREIPTMQWRE